MLKHFIKANFFPEGGWELHHVKRFCPIIGLGLCFFIRNVYRAEWRRWGLGEFHSGATSQWSLTLCEWLLYARHYSLCLADINSFNSYYSQIKEKESEAHSLSNLLKFSQLGCDFLNVNPWLIQFKVWQNPLQYCKVISL